MKVSKEELINYISTIILVVVLTLIPLINIPTIPHDFPRMIILLPCGFALLILIPFKIKKNKIDKTDLCIITFAILAILSTIFSSRINVSLLGERQRYEGIFIILTYILIYFHAKYSFIKFKKLENVLIVEYIAICILAIIQYYTPESWNIPLISEKAMGTFGNTNFFGSFISLVLPGFMFLFITKGNRKYIFGSSILFSAMIMCGARSSWVAFVSCIIGICIYLIVKKDKVRLKRFIILVIAFAMCFAIIKVTTLENKWIDNRINLAINEIQEIATEGVKVSMGSGRVRIWEMTLDVVIKKPLLGCGVDNLLAGIVECAHEKLEQYIIRYFNYVDKAHNEYLHIAATMGIPALIAYIGFVGSIMNKNFKKCFKDDKNMLYILIIGSYLVQAFFNISIISVAPIFWFALGMAAREAKENKEKTL